MQNTKSKLSQVSLAVAVCVGAAFFVACGPDMSKAPKVELSPDMSGFFVMVASQNDNTIVDDIVVIGRNGECKVAQTGKELMQNSLTAGYLKGFGALMGAISGQKTPTEEELAGPIFNGKELPYGEVLMTKTIGDCPAKNGTYKVEVLTNFGTYKYDFE